MTTFGVAVVLYNKGWGTRFDNYDQFQYSKLLKSKAELQELLTEELGENYSTCKTKCKRTNKMVSTYGGTSVTVEVTNWRIK